MKQVTRNIDPDSARDLLQRVPRACLAFGNEDGPQAQPVVLHWREPQHLVGIPQSAVHRPSLGQEVVLLVDEGIHYFDLRAIYIRGIIQLAPQTFDATPGYAWFEIIPSKTIAWDYGTMHEVDDEHK
jgi:hypothetical protein